MRRGVSLVLIGAGFGLGACSTTRGPEANLVRFQRTVGQATPSTARELAMRIITQYGFVVEREQPIPNLVIHTRWRERAPFPDEEALGISHAQNRMVIMTRPRSSTNNQVTHSVDVSIENRVQLVGSEAWTDASATREYEKWASRIIEDFTRELNVGGVRR
jgi:hypothetical protein